MINNNNSESQIEKKANKTDMIKLISRIQSYYGNKNIVFRICNADNKASTTLKIIDCMMKEVYS